MKGSEKSRSSLLDRCMGGETQVLEVLGKIKQQGQNMLKELEHGIDVNEFIQRVSGMGQVSLSIKKIVPSQIYDAYTQFFDMFHAFCRQCEEPEVLMENMESMASCLSIFVRCMEDLEDKCAEKNKKCACCSQEVVYHPLSGYFDEMQKKFHVSGNRKYETLNYEEYICPNCGASDRDRMLISFLKKENLRGAAEGTKILQIAPAEVLSRWILEHCPQALYETTDLYMDHVTFHSDIQNMDMVPDESYDVIICSHVLEHVKDDRKALRELKRILKPQGKVIFLVPVDLNREDIDEEWGLPEEENWRRFGQGDHCRVYGKQGLLRRLQEEFHVQILDKSYFGDEIFAQCALTDTSTLYILTKEETVSLSMAEEIVVDEKLCHEGPLVSVVLPCYNHEAFVAEAIESVLNQSYKNIEFIVADDASTDGTADIMRKYSSYFTKEFYLEENTGCGIFKVLEQAATGKYIALMHSDDVWEPNKLAVQVDYMEKHEECGACFTWCVYINDQLEEINDPIFFKTNRSSEEWMHYFWEHSNVLCNPSSLTRREINIRDGMNPCRQLPDFFKWVEAVQRTSIHIIPKVLVRMRIHLSEQSKNASAPTKVNQVRSGIEEGNNWMWAIRNMKNDFFVRAFHDLMVDSQANTDEEIKCEKYFLMLRSTNPLTQNSAFCYLVEIFGEVEECMKRKYHYTRNNIAEDIVAKGVARLFL